MICSRCGKPESGYHAHARCSCLPARSRTMSRDQRISELTDEGVLAHMERITGVSDRQNRSEDRAGKSERGLGAMARRSRAAQRAAGYDPDEAD